MLLEVRSAAINEKKWRCVCEREENWKERGREDVDEGKLRSAPIVRKQIYSIFPAQSSNADLSHWL